jgi:hypothetical protein
MTFENLNPVADKPKGAEDKSDTKSPQLYEMLVGRDFPGYKRISFWASSDAEAIFRAKRVFDSIEEPDSEEEAFRVQWSLGCNDRIVQLITPDRKALLEGWSGEAVEPENSQQSGVVTGISQVMRSGLSRDFWYDAAQYGDTEAQRDIEEFQFNIEAAAVLIERQNRAVQKLQALIDLATAPGGIGEHEFNRPGGWRAQAIAASKEASDATSAVLVASKGPSA